MIAALSVLIFAGQAALFWRFTIDDAYITFRYIRQFVAGNGLVFNIGERVEGYSNFLWLMTLAPFYALGLDVVITAKALGIMLALITLWLTAQLAAPGGYGWTASILLAASAPFAIWSVGGLETMLFACLFAASALAFVREEERGQGVVSGALFALLALTRPEGVMFGALAALFRAVNLWRARQRPELRDWARLALWIAPPLVHLGWRISYYGYPLPNTVYAKSLGLHPRAFVEGAYYLYTSAMAIGGALPLLIGGLAVALHRSSLRYAYLLASVLAYAAFTLVSGGDWMPAQRFLAHILPAVMALICAGMVWITEQLTTQHRTLLLSLIVSAQTALLIAGGADLFLVQRIGNTVDTIDNKDQIEMLHYIKNLEPGESIAVNDAGMISFVLPLDIRVIDMFGLADQHIAHLTPRLPGGILGRGDAFGKWDVDYVLAQTPKLIQLALYSEPDCSRFVSPHTSNNELLADPRFQQHYQPVGETLPLRALYQRVAP